MRFKMYTAAIMWMLVVAVLCWGKVRSELELSKVLEENLRDRELVIRASHVREPSQRPDLNPTKKM